MYGRLLGTSIAVDCFQEVTRNGMYFLTEGWLSTPLPQHVDRVYTSAHNAWLLRTQSEVSQDRIVKLPIGEKLLIQDNIKKLHFYVTLIDAKQKPGVVMFLFEGKDIGNILYAGKCCYDGDFKNRPLASLLEKDAMDYLFIHESCVDCHSHSKLKTAAVDEIIDTIKWNSNCKVVIIEPCFREDIIIDINNKLKKAVCVSENIMKHLQNVGLAADFSTDRANAQVLITDSNQDRRCFYGRSVLKIIVIPCSMKRTSQEIQVKLYKLEKKSYHVIFYRNHCSEPELMDLVTDIRAKHTVLIRPPPLQCQLTNKKKDLDFWFHLGNVPNIIQTLDAYHNETRVREIMEVEEEPDNTGIMCEMGVSDIELQKAVKCIMENEDNYVIETTNYTNNARSEAASPNSFILIESDIVSITSQETAPRSG